MQTDIPLKRLTLLRAADLLPLLGTPDAQVVAVESLELPASAARLDTVLRLRSPGGQEYLHVIEWQGYVDPVVLWRVAGYLAWLGQRFAALPITGTVIYLTPAADMGTAITQTVEAQAILHWPIPCVRLWEQDAATAVASGATGLAVLSPLMHGATAALVTQALDVVLRQTVMPQQADLLSILGVFAEPLIDPQHFVRSVGKERLMASDLLSYLMDEKMAELEAEKTAIAAQLATLEAQTLRREQATLQSAIAARFPDAPIALTETIRQITDPDRLQQLTVAVIRAADLDAWLRELHREPVAP